MLSDRIRWNKKYARFDVKKNIFADRLLVEHQHEIPRNGWVLDLAGGTGDNALYLCKLGCQVVNTDISETGLRACQTRAIHHGLNPMLVVADLNRFPLPPDIFDGILVFYYLNRSLVESIKASLKSGGIVFYKTFNNNHLKENPGFPRDYTLESGELDDWFNTFQCISKESAENSDQTLSHYVGRKP